LLLIGKEIMSEEQATFKVTDRRLFNPDGTLREELPRAEETPKPAPEPAPALSNTAAAAPAAAPVTEEPIAQDEPDDINNPAGFINFVMSLASNAAASLGMMEHPATGQVGVDLQMAQYWIEILAMLRRKTSGNLSGREIEVFDGLLSDLRMQYVALTQPRPKPSQFSAQDIMGRR
jgi:hypothetical protein